MNALVRLLKSSFPVSGWKAAALIILSQIVASHIVNRMSYTTLKRIHPLLRPLSWEKNGRFYDNVFHIRQWKDYIPSVSSFNKKNLSPNPDITYLYRFILESVRAELCHILAIIFSFAIMFITPPSADRKILLWTVAVNIPCIMIQRFNRPRLEEVLHRLCKEPGAAIFWNKELASEVQEERK